MAARQSSNPHFHHTSLRRRAVARRRKAAAFSEPLAIAIAWPLLATLTLVVAPQVTRLPVWITTLVIAIGVWRACSWWRGWRRPPSWLRGSVAVIGFVTVFAAFGQVNGRQAGLALLVLMLGLKLTELDTRRDAMIAIYLGYFLLVAQCLFSQSLPTAVWLIIGIWLLTANLLQIAHRGPVLHWRTTLAQSCALCLQALPLMLALFILFPRLPGPLWGRPNTGQAATTGLSDHMSPGSVSRLALSGAVAFRVRFQGPPPVPAARYWRGPVFSDFDGRTWRQAPPLRSHAARPAVHVRARGRTVNYSVTIEPTGNPWLVALTMPITVPEASHLNAQAALVASSNVDHLRRYKLSSVTRYRLQASHLGAQERRRDLALPGSAAPRTRALVARWQARGIHGAALAERALRYIRHQNFHYTLSPPPLDGPQPVDAFVFGTRRGFCEHFASAFTVMMRAGGIPARVVTGYQGGQTSAIGDYMIVRESDAHAWSEIWLAGQGWVREDPTAAVAPQRIELGLGAALPNDRHVPAMARGNGNWLQALQLRWDWVDAQWNRYVLAYGPMLQTSLLRHYGLDDLRRMILALTALITALLTVTGLALAWRARPRRTRDPVLAAWQRVGRRLARAGLARGATEGPRDYARRVAAARPDLTGDIHSLCELYIDARYRAASGHAISQRLRRRSKSFRPPRRAPR